MGNVNEPSADGVPGEHEDSPSDAQESSSYDVSGQLRANVTSEVTLPTPEQRLQPNPDTGDLGSQPPSRVLIHEEDSTNVWIPLPDAMAAQPSVELDTDVAPDSANSSFPLSDSELPETFDASMNHVDLSDFFVCPVASDLEISVNDQKASVPCAEAETVKVAQGELLTEPPLIDFEHDLRPSSVPSISAAIRASVLSGDAPCFIPKHQELNMSEQFSRLESTMSDILSSPVPVYPAVMGQILEVPTTKHVPVFAKSQHSVQAPQSSKFGHPATTTEETQISTPPLLNDLPIIVNTYADATNLALQYPELADQILAHPLPKPPPPILTQEKILAATQAPKPLSSSLHHPDRPHWAAAALREDSETPEALPVPPQSRDNKDTHHEVSDSSRFHRRRGNDSGSSIPPTHHDNSQSRLPQKVGSGRRHELPPHRIGAEHIDPPPHLIPLIQQLSDSRNPWAIDSENGGNDTGTALSPTRNWDRGTGLAETHARDILSGVASPEHSDVGADHEVASEWLLPDVNGRDLAQNATNRPHDEAHQQAPSLSGYDRLGRHVISPRTIGANHEPERTVSRRAHKRQVADLNIATRRYLGGGSNRGSRRASSSASSNRSVEITGLTDASSSASSVFSVDKYQVDISGEPSEGAHRLDGSPPRFSLPPSREIPAEEELTPMLPSGESPFREIQLRTNNVDSILYHSPKASADPRNISLSTRFHVSPRITSLSSHENHPVGDFNNRGSEWLVPPEHTEDDWLPPGSTRPNIQNALSPSQILPFANSSGAFLPPKYMSNSNSNHQGRRTEPYVPLELDSRTKDAPANRFGDPAFTVPSAGINGPASDNQRRYPRRARQSLPAQSEVFSQHLAQAYPSGFGNGGRGWRGRGRGARSASAQNSQRSYGP